jgi:hypothetical protein
MYHSDRHDGIPLLGESEATRHGCDRMRRKYGITTYTDVQFLKSIPTLANDRPLCSMAIQASVGSGSNSCAYWFNSLSRGRGSGTAPVLFPTKAGMLFPKSISFPMDQVTTEGWL